ncbi:uncharacterized protein TNCV_3547071 [Trichonephila clavipes]|nr:uncharacterized protein TNCV_3547071 [Trichonephila clavipes]
MLTSHCSARRGLLATDHVILNHGQVTWTTPELAPPLLTTTPHQREGVSALERFNVHQSCHKVYFVRSCSWELIFPRSTKGLMKCKVLQHSPFEIASPQEPGLVVEGFIEFNIAAHVQRKRVTTTLKFGSEKKVLEDDDSKEGVSPLP